MTQPISILSLLKKRLNKVGQKMVMGGREECLSFQFCGRFLETTRKKLDGVYLHKQAKK